MRVGLLLPCTVMAFLLLVHFPARVFADPAQEILRQQNQIIQQEEQRRQHRESEIRQRRENPPEPLQLPEPAPAPVTGEAAVCFGVQSIVLEGVTLLSAAEQDALLAPYREQCLSLDDMHALVRDITNAYVDKGYVAARAFLPEQDLSGGVLHIAVVEGFVEGLILNDGSGLQQNQLRTAFPGLAGYPLNLRDLEQGLDQMNRLPSNDARMRLEPGAAPGGSVVHIENAPKKRWRAGSGLANNGQDTTGRDLYTLSFEKDNLIGLNDQFSFHHSADARAIGGTAPRSSSVSGYMSAPYGYWTVYASLSSYSYATTLQGLTGQYTSSGETVTTSLGVDRVVHRDAASKTIAGVSLTKREVANFIDEVKLKLSSYDLATATLRLQHSRRVGQSVLSLGAEYHHGMAALGAERNPYHLSGIPDTEYDRYVATASASVPLTPIAQSLALRSSLHAQYSPNTLYGAEQISVGGLYTVRGFHDESVSANMGGYMRNELGWGAAVPEYMGLNKAFSAVQPYLFYDAGYVHPLTDRERDRGMLQGTGIGVRLQGDIASIELMTGKPVDRPASIRRDPWTTYASIKFTF